MSSYRSITFDQIKYFAKYAGCSGYAYISKYRIDVLCIFVGYGEK